MRLRALALACSLAVHPIAHAAGERPTARCNASFFESNEVTVEGSTTVLQQVTTVVANPASDPDLYQRLWRPVTARSSRSGITLSFDRIQDPFEIGFSIRGDARLIQAGMTGAAPSGFLCTAEFLPAPRRVVTEYHNRLTDHYFLSSSDGENAVIDAGAAGPGWERTGEVFDATHTGSCMNHPPVFRFYTPGANSHFFTADPGECGLLRNNDPGWIFEGPAFSARVPVDGACPAHVASTPVYRLYNNRWMHNDSNHRFVKRLDLYQQMQARGWVGEGIAMCLVNPGG